MSYAMSAQCPDVAVPVRTCQMTIGIHTNLATLCMAPNLAATGGRLAKIGLLLCEEFHGHLKGLTRAELRAVLGLGMSGSETTITGVPPPFGCLGPARVWGGSHLIQSSRGA
jgi:hypothetical protein